jgi:signal transduction histidine kinase
MPSRTAAYPAAAESLPSLKSMLEWVRTTYQAPFQDPVSAKSIRDLERFRRTALLRVIIFTITLLELGLSLPATLFFQASPAAIAGAVVAILIGVISLWCIARGWITLAGALYLYSFLLVIYLYVSFGVSGVDALTISIYGFINVLLFLGGLAFSQKAVWPNGVLVVLLTSALLLLKSPNQATTPEITTDLPGLIAILDASYLLNTFLCWLAGRSGRVSMIRLATILEQEQRLVALKDLFIVSANHELRTPIMTLSNNLELVSRTLDRVDAQERSQMLERALRASRDLKGLLSNVLDAGVAEGDARKHLHLEPLSVRALVQQALDTFDPRELGEPWLEQTTLNSRPITLYIAPDLVIRADSGRTRQVLVNLLSNALKYSNDGSPIVLSAQQLESDGRRVPGKPFIPEGTWVQVTVRDWGLGVPPKEQALLFQRFVRLARDAGSATRGTGVGLYLCRVLVQAMGGQIWVESTGIPGEGSVFAFVLPAAQTNPA